MAWSPSRRGDASAAVLTLIVVLGGSLTGCGSDLSGPDSDLRLVAVSVTSPNVTAGELAEDLLAVRLEGPSGAPVSGADVRFLSTDGGGAVGPQVVPTDESGVARASFLAGISVTDARVRADVPEHPGVRPVVFRVRIRPVARVALAAAGGADQSAEVNSQLPLAFVAGATLVGAADDGTPAAGVPLVWRLVRGTAGARLTADTAFTDAAGRTRALLTLGDKPGVHRVRLFAAGPYASDTIEFTASAVANAGSAVRIDSVRPAKLRAGSEARLFGSGFGADPEGLVVFVEGKAAEVLAVEDAGGASAAATVRFRVPAFADLCLPERRAGVRARVGDALSNGLFADLVPGGAAVDLQPGEVRVLSEEEADCVRLGSETGSTDYFFMVQSAARTAGAVTPVRLIVRTGVDASGALADVNPQVASSAAEAPAGAARWTREPPAHAAELRIRRLARAELRRTGARAAPPLAGRGEGRPAASALGPFGMASAIAAEPRVGDPVRYALAIDASTFAVSCTDTAAVIEGIVRAVGDRVLVVGDADPPPGGYTAAEWAALGRDFDELIVPTDEAYFGEPADIDGNGRIVVVVTKEVNRLNRGGTVLAIGGFFLPLDLADSGSPDGGGLPVEGETCPTSNEAEIVYVLAPDPEGVAGPPLPKAAALGNARAIGAHEIQHLLSAERRVILGGGGFDAQEALWLAEAMSHLAEEVVGFSAAGHAPGTELDLVDFPRGLVDEGPFRTYHFSNFVRLRLYMNAPAVAPVISGTDPLGLESLQMRGFGWAFLRWLADVTPGADTELFRRLAGGGPEHLAGIENVEAATGRPWEDLISEFAPALAAEGLEDSPFGAPHAMTSWNLRDTYRGLQARTDRPDLLPPQGYPLLAQPLFPVSSAFDFELGASTAAYFRLQAPPEGHPAMAFEIGSQAGGELGSGAATRVIIGRAE